MSRVSSSSISFSSLTSTGGSTPYLRAHGRVYMCTSCTKPILNCFLMYNSKLFLLCSKTYLETMRPISSRQRQTCRGSLCSTEAENTTINRLLIHNLKRQLPLLSLERWNRMAKKEGQCVTLRNVTWWAHKLKVVIPWGVVGWFMQKIQAQLWSHSRTLFK